MYSSLSIMRQWSKLLRVLHYSTAVEGQKLPQTSTSSDGISPPPRIPRNSTDILEALAATVGPDPTAAHYKYHDDPYLIPLSNFRKRSYALSSEAGRRAAVWVRDNHPELFTMREWDPPSKMKTPYYNADPHIDAFVPKPIYTPESKVTEDDLKYTIENALVEDSLQVYQLLGGAENLSEEVKLKYLQLLCFYNEKEAESLEWMEERWFSSNVREKQAATWRVGGLADTIFQSLEPKTSAAYCAMIQGMAKYYQGERAHMLAQEAIENGIPLSTEVYNSLIRCIGFLKEGTTLRIETLKSTLVEMNQQGLSPNEGTLISCLQSLSAWGGGRVLQQYAKQVLAEFQAVGISPGLSAYYYLLCLFCKERGPRIDILTAILNDLEKRDSLEPQYPTDVNFFITAMGVCSDHLQSITLADRLHTLLMKGNNYKLVGDAYKESIYYRHYVTVNCRHAPFEKTMEVLDTLIPNVYVPEPSVMEETIKTLELSGAGDRLAQSWSQLVVFGLSKRLRLVENLLSAMVSCYQYQEPSVKEKMRTAAGDVMKYFETLEEEMDTKELRTPPPKLSANALCNIAELCSDVETGADEGWEITNIALQRLQEGHGAGVPDSPVVLATLADKAAASGRTNEAAMALSYLAECGFDEAMGASVKVLGTMLNREEKDVLQILREPRIKIADSLHPAALKVFDAYHMSISSPVEKRKPFSQSQESSNSSQSSDDER